jgi:hypothetical protein
MKMRPPMLQQAQMLIQLPHNPLNRHQQLEISLRRSLRDGKVVVIATSRARDSTKSKAVRVL